MNPASVPQPISCAPPCVVLPSCDDARERARGADSSRWFKEKIQAHEFELRAYLRGRFPSLRDIDDLVQETYARVFRARQAGELKDVRPYLFAIARNAAIDVCRRHQIVAFESVGENERLSVVEDNPNAAEIVSHDQEVELLHEAIRALPERCREVLMLRRFEGLSHREIARKLGIAEKTVDAQLCIGVFRCRQYLAARGVSRDRLAQAGRTPIHLRQG